MSLGLMMTIEWSWVVPRTRMSGASHLMVVVMVVAGIHIYIYEHTYRSTVFAGPSHGV